MLVSRSVQHAYDRKALRLFDPRFATVPREDVLLKADGRVHISITAVAKLSQTFYKTETKKRAGLLRNISLHISPYDKK